MRSGIILIGATVLLCGAGCASTKTITMEPVVQPANAKVEISGALMDTPIILIQPSGFSPQKMTVKKGQMVKWLNSDAAAAHQPAADPHPTHATYPTFDAKRNVKSGEAWSFTFKKVGTFGYHDHAHPEIHGTIVVTE